MSDSEPSSPGSPGSTRGRPTGGPCGRGSPASKAFSAKESAERQERVRDNQRRSRKRRREHLAELEARIRSYELNAVAMSSEVQRQARRVASENESLRHLIGHLGIDSSRITRATCRPTAHSVSLLSSSANVRELCRVMQPRGRVTPPPDPRQPTLPASLTWIQPQSSSSPPGFQPPLPRRLPRNNGDPHWTPTDRNPNFDFSQYRDPQAHVPDHERDLILPRPGSSGRQRRQQLQQGVVLPPLGSPHQNQHQQYQSQLGQGQQYSNQLYENPQYHHVQHLHQQDFFPPPQVSYGQQQPQQGQYSLYGLYGHQQYSQDQSFVLPPPVSSHQQCQPAYQEHQHYETQQRYHNQQDGLQYLGQYQMNILQQPN